MMLIDTISAGVSRTFESLFDSRFGLGTLHSLPWKTVHAIWDSRFRQTVQLLLTGGLGACSALDQRQFNNHNRVVTARNRFETGRVLSVISICTFLSFLVESHFTTRPISEAMYKNALTNAAVATADAMAFSAAAMNESCAERGGRRIGEVGGLAQNVGFAWIAYRFADIWACHGNASSNLIRSWSTPLQEIGDASLPQIAERNLLWHETINKLTEWCWDNRLRHATTALIGGASIAAIVEEDAPLSPLSISAMLFINTGIHYLWKTKCLFNPLDSAVAKSIAVDSLISTFDAVAIRASIVNLFANQEQQTGEVSQALGYAWLAFRMFDIIDWSRTSDGLLRGDFTLLGELAERISWWIPEI